MADCGSKAAFSTKLAQGRAELVGRDGADHARNLLTVFKKDGRGPQFYPERAAEWPARPIFEFDVLNRRIFRECFGYSRRGGLTMATPSGPEF